MNATGTLPASARRTCSSASVRDVPVRGRRRAGVGDTQGRRRERRWRSDTDTGYRGIVDARLPNRMRAHTVRTVLAVGIASLSLACTGNPTQPTDIPLGQSFDLRSGASATLQDGLKVTFNSVQSDSRCPMDAICIWGGDATVKVALSRSGGSHAERDLHTDIGGSQAAYLSYVIKLVTLAPYPRSDRPILPEDYVATLVVDAG